VLYVGWGYLANVGWGLLFECVMSVGIHLVMSVGVYLPEHEKQPSVLSVSIPLLQVFPSDPTNALGIRAQMKKNRQIRHHLIPLSGIPSRIGHIL
jgi:hypothetical protein